MQIPRRLCLFIFALRKLDVMGVAASLLTGFRLYIVMAIIAVSFPFEPYGRRSA